MGRLPFSSIYLRTQTRKVLNPSRDAGQWENVSCHDGLEQYTLRGSTSLLWLKIESLPPKRPNNAKLLKAKKNNVLNEEPFGVNERFIR
jgi:hypothetical protein